MISSRSRAVVSHDRAEEDRFRTYVGAVFGHGLPAQAGLQTIDDRAKLQFAGLFAMSSRPPDGLRAVLTGYFGLPVQIREFMGEWLTLHPDDRFRLGYTPDVSSLGRTTVLGRRVFSRSHKFRVVLGPLNAQDFSRFLPGAAGLAQLSDLVKTYAGAELGWDLELIPARDAVTPLRLGREGRLGLGAALGKLTRAGVSANVVVDPLANSTHRSRA